MSLHHAGPDATHSRSEWRTVLLYIVGLAILVSAGVYPLRRYVVEPRREALMGHHEDPARRLSEASQFGFDTAAGSSVRLVPGAPTLELEDLPGEALTLILGGFRGPYVVWLWMSAEEQKQHKIHLDLLSWYTKIATLQSDYPQVWVFNAWNLGWNVSVQWQSQVQKYQWIRRAADYLKEGYRKNPHSTEIMEELGRIYSEKLGRAQEAPYYRQRAKEDEGRSPFLIAYEWYDRSRKASALYGTSSHSLSRPVAYSMACHCLTYYATELTQQMYDTFRASLDSRKAGREADARREFQEGLRQLEQAIGAWDWASREWNVQASRFENERIPADLLEVYRRFHHEAGEEGKGLQTFRAQLTYENLPERFTQLKRPEIQ